MDKCSKIPLCFLFSLFLFTACKKNNLLSDPVEFPDTIFVTAVHDTSICIWPNQSVAVNITTGNTGAKYAWFIDSAITDSVPVKIFSPKEVYNLYYQVKIESATYSNTFSLYVANCQPGIFFPNSFAPNGDGKNDSWSPKGTGIAEIYFEIRNKNGKRLFKSNDLNKPWNSEVKNITVPIGLYHYLAEWQFIDGSHHKQKGTLTVIK